MQRSPRPPRHSPVQTYSCCAVPAQLELQTHRASLTLPERCGAFRLLCTRNAPDTDVCVRRSALDGSLRNSPILRMIFYYTHFQMSSRTAVFYHIHLISAGLLFDIYAYITTIYLPKSDRFCKIVPHETFSEAL